MEEEKGSFREERKGRREKKRRKRTTAKEKEGREATELGVREEGGPELNNNGRGLWNEQRGA